MELNLPKDAEGREIPRNAEVMYDINGKKVHITSFTYRCDVHGLWSQWKVFSPDIKGEDNGMLPADSLYLAPPDSWEKLKEDLDRALSTPSPDTYASITCGYFDSANVNCAVCERKHGIRSERCTDDAWMDIASRIRKLRGADE